MRYSHLLFMCWASMSAFATDRVVSPTGTYSTITSAIAASSDGDRILVQAGTYVENVGITRTISVLPLVEGTRYTILGATSVVHGNSVMQVSISGLKTNNLSSSGGPGRLDIQVVDSWLGFASFPENSSRVTLLRDTIKNGVLLASGTMAGCEMGPNDPGWTLPMVQLASGSTLPDENWLVGNAIRFSQSVNNTPSYLIEFMASWPFHFENNYVSILSGNTRFCRIDGTPSSFQAQSTIINNTFLRNGAPLALITTFTGITLVLANNAVTNDGNPMVLSSGGSSPVLLSSGNLTANNLSWFNNATGQPTAGSPLINGGNPEPRYLDLDLTTNDVGCYGGSNSRANFTTPMGSAVVGFMHAPRVVAQNQPVIINAVGFDR